MKRGPGEAGREQGSPASRGCHPPGASRVPGQKVPHPELLGVRGDVVDNHIQMWLDTGTCRTQGRLGGETQQACAVRLLASLQAPPSRVGARPLWNGGLVISDAAGQGTSLGSFYTAGQQVRVSVIN